MKETKPKRLVNFKGGLDKSEISPYPPSRGPCNSSSNRCYQEILKERLVSIAERRLLEKKVVDQCPEVGCGE